MHNISLTNEQKNLLYNVFYFKSLTVPQAQQLLYENENTMSREKRLYQMFNVLRYMGLIHAIKPIPKFCNHRTHYLSKNGLDYVQATLKITPEKSGNGWKNSNMDHSKIDWRYFSYNTYIQSLNSYKEHHRNVDNLITLYRVAMTFRSSEFTLIRNEMEVKINNEIYSLNSAENFTVISEIMSLLQEYKTHLEIASNSIQHIVFLYNDYSESEVQKQLIKSAFTEVFSQNTALNLHFLTLKALIDKFK